MATVADLLPADIASTVLGFSDAEFLAAPEIDVHEREVQLLDMPFDGVAIAAQAQIDVDAQASLPIAIALRSDGERDWDLPLPDNALLVATNLQSGQVQVAPALLPAKALASRHAGRAERNRAPRPPAEDLAGTGAQIAWTEGRSRIEIGWSEGAWVLGLLYFDWLSNLVTVHLAGGTAPEAATPGLRAPSPMPARGGPALPTYRCLGRTPPLLTEGVSFEVSVDQSGGTARLLLNAAFAATATAFNRAEDTVVEDGDETLPVAALVPLSLLLVAANSLSPWRRDLVAPVYGPPAADGDILEGCVALDVLDGESTPAPGAYVVYLVLEGKIHGPKPILIRP